MKFKFKKTILGIFTTAAFSVLYTGNVNAAGWPVSDLELISYLGGATTGGGGVVELLTALNSSIAQTNGIMKNQSQNDFDTNQNLLEVGQTADRYLRHITDINGCTSPTRASGGGKGSVSSVSSGFNNVVASKEIISDKTPRAEKYETKLIEQNKIGLCTTEDITLKTYGCTSKGEYSANQGNAIPILYPALKDSEMSTVVPMGGLNKEQQLIRNHNFGLIVGVDTLPPLQSPKQMQTEEGAAYENKRQQQNTRKTLALGMFLKESAIENNSILTKDANGNSVEKSLNGFLKNGKIGSLDWNGDTSATGPKAIWSDVFGSESEGVKFPEKPSEWDYLTYQVYSRYAATGPESVQTMISSMSQEDVLKEIFRMNAVSLRLQMLGTEYQRDTNTLLSLIASVLIEKNDPSTQSALKKDVDIIPTNK